MLDQGFLELLTFGMQMTLLLILCDSVARTPLIIKLLRNLCYFPNSPRQIIFLATFLACILGLITWGLGLVGGAIIAREFGKYSRKRGIKVHYPLVVASAYTSLMVWHCGFSGSIPLFIATPGHIFEDTMGIVPFSETVGSICNLGIVMGLLAVIPFVMAFMHPKGEEVVEVPILIPTSQALGISMQKTALIDMMGDQLTNMVQPFWALPLLGIARLEAKDILGYTTIAMVFGFLIMALGLTFLPAG